MLGVPSGDSLAAVEISPKRHFSDDASTESADNRKRRTTGSTSSRGVANLTPEQLAKKRANDREAQRAIRERTKSQIETLERRIAELTSQRPYQELQHALRQKELVEAENADIKKRLTTVVSLIQQLAGPACQDASATAGLVNEAQDYASPYIPHRPEQSSRNTSESPAVASDSRWQQSPAPTVHDPRTPAQAPSMQHQRQGIPHRLELAAERQGVNFLLDHNDRGGSPPVPNDINGVRSELPSFPPLRRSSEIRSPALRTQQTPLDRSNSVLNTSSITHTNTTQTLDHLLGHSAPIRNGPPTCPLDSVLLDFLHERQQQALDGVHQSTILGPAFPAFSVLLNPSLAPLSHPLSKVLTDILATFPDISALPEKVAVLYIMFLIMRWQMSPTPENYERLPEWAMPRPSQLFTKHPAWVDHAPWPRMRDRLVNSDWDKKEYPFEDFFIPFTATLSVDWPYEDGDCLLNAETGRSAVEGDAGEDDRKALNAWITNPVFEKHCRKLENWSLGPAFANAIPALKDTFLLKTGAREKSFCNR